MDNTNTEIFRLLSRWRHYPAYQLERRADIFFALYIAGFICSKFPGHTNIPLDGRPAVIPEFPVRLDIATGDDSGTSASKNVDYVVPLRGTNGRIVAVFVEFKTDELSAGNEQLKMMKGLHGKPLEECLDALPSIAEASLHWRKYYHLLRDLEECGLIEGVESGLEEFYSRPSHQQQGRTAALKKIKSATFGTIQSAYLTPTGKTLEGKFKPVYTFSHFAEYLKQLENDGDKFAGMLAQTITDWAKWDAGDIVQD